jgi:hypothetical protein
VSGGNVAINVGLCTAKNNHDGNDTTSLIDYES